MTEPGYNPARTKARKRALDILFEADLREERPERTLAERVALGEPPVRDFTVTLVEGVVEHRASIDELIGTVLRPGWTLARMPRVDRCLARIATFELLHTDTEPQVAVAEAVTLGRQLSTDDSPAFLNGVLGTILDRLQADKAAAAAAPPTDQD